MSVKGAFSADDQKLVSDLKADVSAVLNGIDKCEVDIGISKGVGKPMGEILNAGKFEGDGEVNIKHEAGQVMLLDFWATWCPPC